MYIGTVIHISWRQLKGWAGQQNCFKIIIGNFSSIFCSRQKFQCQVWKKSVLYVVISTDKVDTTNASVVDSSQPSIEGKFLPPHVLLFLLQLKIQLMRARGPMKMLFALSLLSMRRLMSTISQASIYVHWLENLPFKVCILMSRTPMAASQNRYLSGHNFTGWMPLQEIWMPIGMWAIPSISSLYHIHLRGI